jgi:hypothetical protein
MEKNHDCYKCQFRKQKPGSAHSECEAIDRGIGLMAAIRGIVPGETELNPIGVRGGWAMWPIDFDPTWINRCEFFVEREPAS